jgi:NDP-sugar pyrophosphorylase family protein
MNDLVQELLRKGEAVRAYGFSDEWYDIGTPERLAAARRSFATAPDAYLPSATGLERGARGPDHGTDELVGYAPDGH